MRIGHLIVTVLDLFLYALLARLILDYVRIFARTWRPRGFALYFVEMVYSITDPPMRFIARFVPPLRIGGVSIDLSYIILFMVVQFLTVMLVNL